MLPTEESLVRTCTKLQASAGSRRPGVQSSELVARKAARVRRAHTKPIVPLPLEQGKEVRKDYAKKQSLGMKYFFSEKEVPKELEDILKGYQNYTDGSLRFNQ